MSDILQEIKEKINRLLGDPTFFTAGLLVLVAVASFGLGRQSVGQEKVSEARDEVAAAGQSPAAATSSLKKTADATDSITEPTSDTFYVASKSGSVYHLPYCSGAKRISEKNKVIYNTKTEAEADGLRPAANCPGI